MNIGFMIFELVVQVFAFVTYVGYHLGLKQCRKPASVAALPHLREAKKINDPREYGILQRRTIWRKKMELTEDLKDLLIPPKVTVRRLVQEGRQEKEASFPQFPVGLSDQGSQVVPALIQDVATPIDHVTDMYCIDGNF